MQFSDTQADEGLHFDQFPSLNRKYSKHLSKQWCKKLQLVISVKIISFPILSELAGKPDLSESAFANFYSITRSGIEYCF